MIFCQVITQHLNVEVVKEHAFHPNRKWRFDYAFPQHKIALEVEGGIYTSGRHIRPKGFLGDMEKYNAAAMMGWRVLRCTPKTLLTMPTIQMIRDAIGCECVSADGVDFVELHRLSCPFLHKKTICKDAVSNIKRTCDSGCEFMKKFINNQKTKQ